MNTIYKNERTKCAIHVVMCSALCDESKRRLISWINFFDGNMQKSFAWAIRAVKHQVEMTIYKPTQPIYKQALSDLCAMEKHYT